MPWQSKVPQIEVETHKVAAPDVVVPTLDTVRHEALLYTWLAEHKPLVLCGPPGSGKTMTLFSALRALPDMEVHKRVCVCVHVCVCELQSSSKSLIFLRLKKAWKLFPSQKSVIASPLSVTCIYSKK